MKLQVVVASHCLSCEPAQALAGELAEQCAGLMVEVVDLDAPGARAPDAAFAVPTYVLDGRVLWLGNPDPMEAVEHLQELCR